LLTRLPSTLSNWTWTEVWMPLANADATTEPSIAIAKQLLMFIFSLLAVPELAPILSS
jgi:hypothetical protein